MKVFLTCLLGICCAAVLVLGNMHWKEKTTVQKTEAAVNEEAADLAEAKTETQKENPHENLLSLAANWPESSVKGLEKAISADRTYKIHIVGSESLGEGPESWPGMVKGALLEMYGPSAMEITISSYDTTSLEFVNEDYQEELIKEQADMIILEPFTLKDNGVVGIDDSLDNLSTIMEDVKRENPETTFLIQPPHPLYDANFYPKQVEELKDYAEKNDITYLDHWTEWPDTNNEELKEYLADDSSEPSEKGHELWAGYLIGYLIEE